MAERDFVVNSLIVKQSSIFKIEDLYKILKNFFLDNGYKIREREYGDEERRKLDIKWVVNKKVDDYSKYVIEIKLKGRNIENVAVGNKKMQRGQIQVIFDAYLESDYEDYWEERATSKFFRGIYDRFVLRGKMDKFSDELKEDVYTAYNEVKSYLGLHVMK